MCMQPEDNKQTEAIRLEKAFTRERSKLVSEQVTPLQACPSKQTHGTLRVGWEQTGTVIQSEKVRYPLPQLLR